MNRYRLKYADGVEPTIDKLPGNIRQRIRRLVSSLRDDPYPPEAQQMRDDLRNAWRIQIDAWRIVYKVEDEVMTVEIVRVGRKNGPDRGSGFYRGLRPPKG
jgi:mRNA interferase RelE/StbE